MQGAAGGWLYNHGGSCGKGVGPGGGILKYKHVAGGVVGQLVWAGETQHQVGLPDAEQHRVVP